jgi:hypothetical protein
MKVFEALDLTQRALTISGAFENDDDEDENETFVVWKSFANTLLAWASSRIPEDYLREFKARRETFSTLLLSRKNIDATDPLPYWKKEILTVYTDAGVNPRGKIVAKPTTYNI